MCSVIHSTMPCSINHHPGRERGGRGGEGRKRGRGETGERVGRERERERRGKKENDFSMFES